MYTSFSNHSLLKMFLRKKKRVLIARKRGTSTPNTGLESSLTAAPSGASSIQGVDIQGGGGANSCPTSSREDLNDRWDNEIEDFSYGLDRTSPPATRADTPSLDTIRESIIDIRERLNGINNIAVEVDTGSYLSKVDQLSKELDCYIQSCGSNSLVVELDRDLNELRSVLLNAVSPPQLAQMATEVDIDVPPRPIVYPPAPPFQIYHDSACSPPVPTPRTRTSRGQPHEASGQGFVSSELFNKETSQLRRSISSAIDRFKRTSWMNCLIESWQPWK